MFSHKRRQNKFDKYWHFVKPLVWKSFSKDKHKILRTVCNQFFLVGFLIRQKEVIGQRRSGLRLEVILAVYNFTELIN